MKGRGRKAADDDGEAAIMSTNATPKMTARAKGGPEAEARTTAEDTLKQKSRDASLVSGGHLVAKALRAEGVDTIFTLCGGHIIDIYDGCLDEGIRIVDVRHEQTAAHAADGYWRGTRQNRSAGGSGRPRH